MKATVQIERIKPTTSVGEGVKVTYIYTDYDKSVIDHIEKELRSKVNGTTEVEKLVNDVLDKIRAELINRYPKNYMGEPECGGASCVFSLDKVLEIIDKYTAGSEGKTTCENCIYSNECIMYDPAMKRCKDYIESENK